MSPKEPPKAPVTVVRPGAAGQDPTVAAAQAANVPIMVRDEKDQVMDWLFASCRAKNDVIQNMNNVLGQAQQEILRLKAEVETLTAALAKQQPQQPAVDGPGAGTPAAEPATAPITI